MTTEPAYTQCRPFGLARSAATRPSGVRRVSGCVTGSWSMRGGLRTILSQSRDRRAVSCAAPHRLGSRRTRGEDNRMAELRKYRWDDMPKEELNRGLGRRLITGDQVMVAHVYFAKGTEVPRHRHHNEQI